MMATYTLGDGCVPRGDGYVPRGDGYFTHARICWYLTLIYAHASIHTLALTHPRSPIHPPLHSLIHSLTHTAIRPPIHTPLHSQRQKKQKSWANPKDASTKDLVGLSHSCTRLVALLKSAATPYKSFNDLQLGRDPCVFES